MILGLNLASSLVPQIAHQVNVETSNKYQTCVADDMWGPLHACTITRENKNIEVIFHIPDYQKILYWLHPSLYS